MSLPAARSSKASSAPGRVADMPPKSKIITKLSPEARADLDQRLALGHHSLDDLVGWLQELGYEISRSSLGRYYQDFEAVTADIRATRELARAVGRELEDLADGDATAVVVESLHALIFKVRRQMLADEDSLTPKAVADLARAAKDLASALGQRAAMELRIRVEAEKKAKAELESKVKEVEAEVAKTPMTPEQVVAKMRALYTGEG